MGSFLKIPASAITATRLTYLDADEYLARGLTFAKTEPCTVLCQALDGSYELNIGGREIRTQPGEIWIAPANWPVSGKEPGEQSLGGQTRIRWAHLHFLLYDSLDLLSLLELPLKPPANVSAQLGELISEISRSSPQRKGHIMLEDIGRCQARAFDILDLLCTMSQFRSEAKTLLNASDTILPVLQFIYRNYSRHIAVEDLADTAHLSVSRFHKLFKTRLKTSPMEYVKGVRLAEACRMLREHDLTVGQIAIRTGFCDQFHLSREFKKRFGSSPRQYRKHMEMGRP